MTNATLISVCIAWLAMCYAVAAFTTAFRYRRQLILLRAALIKCDDAMGYCEGIGITHYADGGEEARVVREFIGQSEYRA
jgi:hypothetical protein